MHSNLLNWQTDHDLQFMKNRDIFLYIQLLHSNSQINEIFE